jgi:hypothetical protein
LKGKKFEEKIINTSLYECVPEQPRGTVIVTQGVAHLLKYCQSDKISYKILIKHHKNLIKELLDGSSTCHKLRSSVEKASPQMAGKPSP